MTSTIACVKQCAREIGITDISLLASSESEGIPIYLIHLSYKTIYPMYLSISYLSHPYLTHMHTHTRTQTQGIFKVCPGDAANEFAGIAIRSSEASSPPDRKGLPITSLGYRENFSSSIDLICLKDEAGTWSRPQLPCPPTNATIGTLSIQWRLEDPHLLFPSNCDPDTLKAMTVDELRGKMEVLPLQIKEEGGVEGEGCDMNVTASRVCVINFAIPAVQVIDAPFDVTVERCVFFSFYFISYFKHSITHVFYQLQIV